MRNLLVLILILNLLITLPLLADDSQNKVCFREHCFAVELATTPKQRQQGLMFRESLGLDQGMLFIFPTEESHSFWMKNTHLSLDIIWVSKDKRVVFIKKDAKPCMEDSCPIINPSQAALYVLEVNAGRVKQIGLGVGEELEFHIEESHE